MMESQLQTIRDRHGEELAEMESRHADSKRALLEEMSNTQVNARNSPLPFHGVATENRKQFSPTSTPRGQRQISEATNGSARSDRTIDTVTYNSRMDLQAELELTQNKLDMSEMRNRHLQTQLDRSPVKSWEEDSPSVRRMQKLERENYRLHEKLDDSSKKVSVLERSLNTGQLTLKEVQTKSHEELCDFINSQQRDRSSLNQAYTNALNELSDAKSAFEELKTSKAQMESELRNTVSSLSEAAQDRERETANHSQLLQEFSDLQIRLDGETSKVEDLTASLEMYKARSHSYFTQLEQAEMAVLKATKAEEFAKSRTKETDEYCAQMMAERKTLDTTIEDLQRQTQKYEERIEDLSADLEGALQAKRRLQNELEDYRSQRATAIEDKETTLDQTRKKYQSELATLNAELEVEREHVIHEREENGRLHDEIEELRGKWDDEVLNSTSWSKEKKRLDVINQGLIASRDEAVAAHNDAQSRTVTLLSQNRELRDNVMRLETERDTATKERKNIEQRLAETLERMDELARGSSPSVRNAAATDREILELKANLAQQQDINEAALGKMRRSDSLAAEAQNELQTQREANVEILREKAALEKTIKDTQLKLVDLETKSYSTASQDVKFLHGRIQEVSFHNTHSSNSLHDIEKTIVLMDTIA
jgi:myosin protein heavy chain